MAPPNTDGMDRKRPLPPTGNGPQRTPGPVYRPPMAPPPANEGPYVPRPGDSLPDPRRSFNVTGGPSRGPGGNPSGRSVADQTAQQNTFGATPFMDSPGMLLSQQRVNGSSIQGDPMVSAALADFQRRVQPNIQNRAGMMGLGRSSTALNAITGAQGAMLEPLYQDAAGREERRLGNINTAAENELGRRERAAGRVSDANANQSNMLMQMAQGLWGRGQQTGQNAMGAGDILRQITQQGNAADQQDFLRRQALGEQGVLTPFGGLAGAGLGTMTSSTGK